MNETSSATDISRPPRVSFWPVKLSDDQLYPCEAAWCAIFDTLARPPTAEETRRRVCSAALHGIPL